MENEVVYGSGFMAAVVGLLRWSLGRNLKEHDEAILGLKKQQEADAATAKIEREGIRNALIQHQLDVSNNYAKLNTIDRLHDRIDGMAEDIKTILGRVK